MEDHYDQRIRHGSLERELSKSDIRRIAQREAILLSARRRVPPPEAHRIQPTPFFRLGLADGPVTRHTVEYRSQRALTSATSLGTLITSSSADLPAYSAVIYPLKPACAKSCQTLSKSIAV